MRNNNFCRVLTPPGDGYRYAETRLCVDHILGMNNNEIVFKKQKSPIFKKVSTRFDLATDETGGRYWYRHTSVEYPNGEEMNIDNPDFGITNLACLFEYIKAETGYLTVEDDLWFLSGVSREYNASDDWLLMFDVKRIIHNLMYRNEKGATITFDKDESDSYGFRSVSCAVGECSSNFRDADGCVYEDYSDFDDVVYTYGSGNEIHQFSIYGEHSGYATLIALLRRIVNHIYKYGYAVKGEITTASTDDVEKEELMVEWIATRVKENLLEGIKFSPHNAVDGIIQIFNRGPWVRDKSDWDKCMAKYVNGECKYLKELCDADPYLPRRLTNAIISQDVDDEERKFAHSATDILCDLEEKYNLDLDSVQFEVVDAIQKVFKKYKLSVIPLQDEQHYELKKNKDGVIELHSGEDGFIEKITFDNERLDSGVMVKVLKLVADYLDNLKKEER